MPTILASVVTEGRSDAQLLRRLLPIELAAQVEFIIGGGSYGAQSLAGSILASQRRPVVLVVDADGLERAYHSTAVRLSEYNAATGFGDYAV